MSVQRVLEKALTVADLISMLGDFDADSPVLFACNYGDYHSTRQALPVEVVDAVEQRNLVESAYSHSGIAVVGDDGEPTDGEPTDDDDDELMPVVVLNLEESY